MLLLSRKRLTRRTQDRNESHHGQRDAEEIGRAVLEMALDMI